MPSAVPLKLSDHQICQLQDACRQIRYDQRHAFLQLVAVHLAGAADVGDGQLNQAIRATLAELRPARRVEL
jgi:hypothetical protein